MLFELIIYANANTIVKTCKQINAKEYDCYHYGKIHTANTLIFIVVAVVVVVATVVEI